MDRIVLALLFLVSFSMGYAQWPVFEDVTLSRGIDDVASMSYLYGHGAAIADYDNDGDLDFFFCTDQNNSDRLYINNGNGVFTDNATILGVDSQERSRIALWLDYDGDQDLDLLTIGDCYPQTCNDPITIKFYEHQANGSFIEIARSIGLDLGNKYVSNVNIAAGGLSSGDLNNDGYLDIIISVWGGPITYFENTGTGSFVDKSDSSLIGPDFKRRWQPMLYDFNQDGYLDIYCNVDFEANEFWLNNGDGTFMDIAEQTFSDSAYNEMGLTLGDYDNDGDMDIYATNISRQDNGVLRHNILLQNMQSSSGNLTFNEIANDLQVGASGWDWGTTFFEVNNDGKLDLVTTNGWEPSEWAPDASKLWLNLGDGLFGDISATTPFNDTYDATSLMAFDMDRDGDLDLLQTLKRNSNTDAGIKLYENKLNETATPGNYIVIKPRTEDSNHFAIGAVVKITSNNVTQMRLISAGTSFFGQEPAEAYFGLGSATTIDELRIIWPDQTETVIENLSANQELTVLKNQGLSLNENLISKVKIYPNPVDDIIQIQIEFREGVLEIFNLLGQPMKKESLNYGKNHITLDDLSSGLYILQVLDTENGTLSRFQIIKK